ncbi:carbohydrate esterase family 4 protein [Jackrogersella minutella]|nr:carbohydrate esterase family 4 protein [Jackrogersella minutella]
MFALFNCVRHHAKTHKKSIRKAYKVLGGVAGIGAVIFVLTLIHNELSSISRGVSSTSTFTRRATDIPSGEPLFDLPRPKKGPVPYGKAIFQCAKQGQIALAFDDGPSDWTEQIVDLLDAHGFKATFFMTGDSPLLQHRRIDDPASPYPDLLRRMHMAGHQLASHTWTHAHLDRIGRDDVAREMVYNEMAFRNALGLVPTYMRPPYGVWRDEAVNGQLAELGYHVVMYNIDTKDYLHNDRDGIQESVDIFNDAVQPHANGSYIVLAHDVREWTALKLVPAMVKTILVRGYEAVTIGECLDDEDWTNWYRDPEVESP